MNGVWVRKLAPGLSVGWYGIPGGGPGTKIHVHDASRRGPICGSRLGKRQEYQWCAADATEYVECERCKGILTRYNR